MKKEKEEGKDKLIFPLCTNSSVLVQCSLQRAPPCQNKDELGPVVKETSAMGGPWDLIRGLNIPHSEETLAPQPPQPWHPWRPTRLSALFSSALLCSDSTANKLHKVLSFPLSLPPSLAPSLILSRERHNGQPLILFGCGFGLFLPCFSMSSF